MSLAEVYASSCEAIGATVNTAVAAAMGHVVDHKLDLRGKGSLRPELASICLTDEKLVSVCEALMSNTSVFFLDLSYNRLTDAAAATLAKLLETNRTIVSLRLDCNDITEQGANILSKLLQINTTLTGLSMRGNKIGRVGNLALASVLQVNKNLRSLDVGETDLDCSATIAYAAALASNNTVRTLNLDRLVTYTKQEESAVHIAEMLKRNTSVKSLSMQKYGMTDFGVARLCEALKENTTLTFLDLSCNKITRDGARELMLLLQVNTTLETLLLNNNGLEDEGAQILIKGIVGAGIKGIGLAHNNIRAEGLQSVAQGIKAHPALTSIWLWGNPGLAGTTADPTACKAIAAAIDRTTTALPEFEHIDIRAYEVDGRTLIAQR